MRPHLLLCGGCRLLQGVIQQPVLPSLAERRRQALRRQRRGIRQGEELLQLVRQDRLGGSVFLRVPGGGVRGGAESCFMTCEQMFGADWHHGRGWECGAKV